MEHNADGDQRDEAGYIEQGGRERNECRPVAPVRHLPEQRLDHDRARRPETVKQKCADEQNDYGERLADIDADRCRRRNDEGGNIAQNPEDALALSRTDMCRDDFSEREEQKTEIEHRPESRHDIVFAVELNRQQNDHSLSEAHIGEPVDERENLIIVFGRRLSFRRHRPVHNHVSVPRGCFEPVIYLQKRRKKDSPEKKIKILQGRRFAAGQFIPSGRTDWR